MLVVVSLLPYIYCSSPPNKKKEISYIWITDWSGANIASVSVAQHDAQSSRTYCRPLSQGSCFQTSPLETSKSRPEAAFGTNSQRKLELVVRLKTKSASVPTVNCIMQLGRTESWTNIATALNPVPIHHF